VNLASLPVFLILGAIEMYGPPAVYSVGGDVKAPVVTSRVPADYSACQPEGRIRTGAPIVEVVVTAAGHVSSAWIIKSNNACVDERFLANLRSWKFRPGARNGNPVAVRINFTVIVDYR
jgi:TonB family protein